MDRSESAVAAERVARLKTDFDVTVLADWGDDVSVGDTTWKAGTWSLAELERLRDSLLLLADAMNGNDRFKSNLGSVTVKKASIGSHGGEAWRGQVTFSANASFTPWTVVHEFAHIWDEHNGWGLSRRLEKFTGGFTSPLLSWMRKFFRLADLNGFVRADEPGKRGRKPGCNRSGYFYGVKPSGADWNFNRVEDFAESVAMYVGWERGNALSDHARKRIIRYLKSNGEKDDLFGTPDNWADYARYFYPEEGDYTKTKRWRFVEGLMSKNSSD
ncbi:MAG: hypothetical protein QY306_07665 [Anaerolineales bacterium]|nr:MAG: hypothetical protein QY306_07665 [Anaerolineales bacterium]